MRKTLTDKGVAALKPRRQRYAYSDPELRGHYVRVQPSGSKAFVVAARDPLHKQIWVTLGSADVMAIEDARENARAAIRRIKEGKPAIEPPPVQPDSFHNVAQNWIKRHVEKNKLRTRREIERCLAKYVFPHWGNRPFTGMRRSDVSALLDYVEDNHGAPQADKVLKVVRSIGNWYATRNDDYISPFTRGMGRSHNGARSRILDAEELRKVWKQAEASNGFGAFVQMLLLTAQRSGAVRGMRFADIEDGVWTIPAEKRAKTNAGSLQLPAQALVIINTQPRLASNPYVFAASRGNGPMNAFSRAKRVFDGRCGVTGWTLHDLRRTARSLMSEAGVSSEHSERVMGHAIAGVEGVYDRHQYDSQKADALRRLAARINAIVNPPRGNVLPMKKGKRR
jgi:integrase